MEEQRKQDVENTSSIANQFVPYELAVKLKHIGFNNACLAHWNNVNPDKVTRLNLGVTNKGTIVQNYTKEGSMVVSNEFVLAPFWQQAFDWFREEHGKNNIIVPLLNNGIIKRWTFHTSLITMDNLRAVLEVNGQFESYEEAREACLIKLIEICQTNLIKKT